MVEKLSFHLLYQLAEKVSEMLRNMCIRIDFLDQQRSLLAVDFTELRFWTLFENDNTNFRRFKPIEHWVRQSELGFGNQNFHLGELCETRSFEIVWLKSLYEILLKIVTLFSSSITFIHSKLKLWHWFCVFFSFFCVFSFSIVIVFCAAFGSFL